MLTVGVATAGWKGRKSYKMGATPGLTAADALAKFSLVRLSFDMTIWPHINPNMAPNSWMNLSRYGAMSLWKVVASRAVWMTTWTAPVGSYEAFPVSTAACRRDVAFGLTMMAAQESHRYTASRTCRGSLSNCDGGTVMYPRLGPGELNNWSVILVTAGPTIGCPTLS